MHGAGGRGHRSRRRVAWARRGTDLPIARTGGPSQPGGPPQARKSILRMGTISMLSFKILDPRCRPEHLGLIPTFLDPRVPLPAWQQIDDNYKHGGGWSSFKDKWTFAPASLRLSYPGDPPMYPLASAVLRDETLYIYPHAWVLIVQPNGDWDLARID